MMATRLLSLSVLLLGLTFSLAEDKKEPITTEEAAKKLNEKVTLKMEVKSSYTKDGLCWLNSESNRNDAKNFTVFLDRPTLKKFKDAKIEDPSEHFKGKKVEVTGMVIEYKEKPQIKLASPEDIKIMD